MTDYAWAFLGALLAVAAWLQLRYNWFTPPSRGLPILMYHQVHPSRADLLTVTVAQLEQHFAYMQQQGYQPIFFRELLAHWDGQGPGLPPRPVLLTFDDGYQNNADYLFPLLEKYQFKATIFLPTHYLGGRNDWDGGSEALMNVATLRAAPPAHVEFGWHSHQHQNYRHLPLAQALADLQQCQTTLTETGLPTVPVLAYPYGGYPKDTTSYRAWAAALPQTGLRLGLRIGNRVAPWPPPQPFAMPRIDIRGTDSFWAFRTKLRKGRVKMF
ncbi:MAG: polysaccharide deacetylase family protein [Bernardetiaceae bacterium]|jgi:peptidoglycan/xylan/chitin deacetylase (PgdA/CDA1 family)|nr:polysaccharide deacetylase family protein [Bernardetiaceae bacterium]